jgi:hypothetical protein
MPRGDNTGPEGKGPRTGRGLGKCKPEEETAGVKKGRPRLGLANRRGGRRGNGRGRNR